MNPFTYADGEIRHNGAPLGFLHAERLLASLDATAADPTNLFRKVDARLARDLRQALAEAQPERQAA